MNYRFTALCFGIIVLSGCSHKKYQVKRVPPLTHERATYSAEKSGVAVHMRQFTAQDSRDYFYDVVLMRASSGIQPVHITITNQRQDAITYGVRLKNGSFVHQDMLFRYILKRQGLVPAELLVVLGVPFVAVCSITLFFAACMFNSQGLLIADAAFLASVGGLAYATYKKRAHIRSVITEQLAMNMLAPSGLVHPGDVANGVIFYPCGHEEVEIVVYAQHELIAQFDYALE